MTDAHGLKFDGSTFWVIHRRREYGPFDYQWSRDLRGLEMTYQGIKFGEHCSSEELFADLKEFHLPRTVVEVSSIVMGCLLQGIVHGTDDDLRRRHMAAELDARGYAQYAASCRC